MSLPYDTQVVAKVASTGNTSPITAATAYSVTADGDYRVSVYMSPQSNPSSSNSASAQWSDGNNVRSINANGTNGPNGVVAALTQIVHAVNGTDIEYSASSSVTFDVYVTVEQL